MTHAATIHQWWKGSHGMTIDVLLKIVELAGSALMGALGAILWFAKVRYEQGVKDEQFKEMQRKLTILMTALYRRGGVEVVLKGEEWGVMNSPLHLGTLSVKAVMPFLDVFLPFYANLKMTRPDITDEELFWAIEEQFGDFIVEKICIPAEMDQLGCLRVVLEFCKIQDKQEGNGIGRADTASQKI